MNVVFLLICSLSIVFFGAFLVECSRPVRKSRKAPVVRKSTEAAVVDSATGRRFLAQLEQQMAEFLSAHHRSAKRSLIAMVLLSIPIGVTVCAAQQPSGCDVPPAAKKMKNPTSLTGEKLGPIAKLYDQKCVACHGEKGASNGPAASSLPKEPANFTTVEVMNRVKDGELFWKITKGCSAMPGYEAEVSETDRWQLVDYVRYLSLRSQYKYLGNVRSR